MRRRNRGQKCLFILLPFIILLGSNSLSNAGWTVVNPPDPGINWNLSSVHFTSLNEGWAIGRGWISDYNISQGILLHYLNGSWRYINLNYVSTNWSISGVHFTSAKEGWVVGTDVANKNALLFHYSEGTWTLVPSPSANWYPNNVFFTSSGEGWVTGQDSTGCIFYHYLNGSWTAVPIPNASLDILSIHFTSSKEGWVVGADPSDYRGVLLHYLNGVWTEVTPNYIHSNYYEFWGVHFTSPNEGWAVGYNYMRGILLHYLDGSWNSVDPPLVSTDWYLFGVHFTSPNEGWAVGYDYSEWKSNKAKGVLLHYVNGSWAVVTPPYTSLDWGLCSVHFTSPYEGWGVGFDHYSGGTTGVLLHYYTPPAGPDLTGSWTTPLTQTCRTTGKNQRCSLKGTFTVSNIGNRDASSTQVKFYLSDNATYEEGDTQLKSVATGKLKPGKSKRINLNVNLPVNQTATGKYVIAVIDKDNMVTEIDEENNLVGFGPIQ